MASDAVEQLIGELVGLTDADPNLARIWVRDAARRSFELRPWSFFLKRHYISLPATQTQTSLAATAAISSGTPDTVTLSTGVVTTAMVGRQFRIGTTGPVFDITQYLSTTSFRISPAWPDASVTGSAFQIFQSRVAVPADCQRILTCVHPGQRWMLHTDVQQETLDWFDPARNRSGSQPLLLASLDWSQDQVGRVYSAVRVVGAGPKPTAGGVYTGQSDAIFTIVVTLGGIGGVATFTYRRNEEAAVAMTSDAVSGNAIDDGVALLWDATATYVLGDTFVVRASALGTPTAPRFEVYPVTGTALTLPIYYVQRYPDVTGDNVPLPGIFAQRPDVIREKALEFASAYPGTSAVPNPTNQINRRDYHAANWKIQIEELCQQDNELFQRNVRQILPYPMAPLPWSNRVSQQEWDDPWIYPV